MKKQTPKISVIIPCYNVEKFLKQCLDSVCGQTLKDIEIICVNDASTDKSLGILKQYAKKDKRIKIIDLQKNSGLSVARNTGIKHATGDFIGFIDSDDWITRDFYEILYTNCIKNNCGIGCGVLRLYENGIYTNLDKHPTIQTEDKEQIFGYITNGSVCTKLIKKSLFEGIQFPSGRYYEDNIVLLKLLLKSNKVYFNDLIFYNYRVNPVSIINNPENQQKRVMDDIYILNEINKVSKENRKYKNIINKTFLKILFMGNEYNKKSEYYKKLNKIFGKKYINQIIFNKKSFLQKIFKILKK